MTYGHLTMIYSQGNATAAFCEIVQKTFLNYDTTPETGEQVKLK